jgi:ethanolamine utilization cobalamin adenosyltransferase
MRNLRVQCGTNNIFQLNNRNLTFKNPCYQVKKRQKAVNRTTICVYDGTELIFKTHYKIAFRATPPSLTAQLSNLIPIKVKIKFTP